MSGKKYDPLVSNLAQVKGLGASGTGTAVWLAQRFTAIALIPLSIWFMVSAIKLITSDPSRLIYFFSSRFNIVLLGLFIYFGLHHAMIGIKEIIEDYVHCTKLKFFLIIILRLFTILTGACGICAVVSIAFLTR